MNAIPIEPATLPRADRAPVAPGGVRVGEPLALGAVLREKPLTVRVGRHIGSVYRKVAAKLGLYFTEGREDTAEAGVEERRVLAQLYREAVERPLRGCPAEHVREGGVLGESSAPTRVSGVGRPGGGRRTPSPRRLAVRDPCWPRSKLPLPVGSQHIGRAPARCARDPGRWSTTSSPVPAPAMTSSRAEIASRRASAEAARRPDVGVSPSRAGGTGLVL